MTDVWGNTWGGATTPTVPTAPSFCGTGLGEYKPPGEPGGDISLSAITVYGGIEVSWTYPALRPQAVAHTLLYRGVTSDFSAATERGVVAGSSYFDKVEMTVTVPIRYFYWIKQVSVNGVVGDLIGPASAMIVPVGEQTIETLSKKIHDGVLATALREDIAKITLNYNELMGEIANRIAGNAALSAALASVQSGLTQSLGLIHAESTVRMDGQNAMASQLNTLAAVNKTNAAAILTEQTARVTATSAMAADITKLYTATGNAASAITRESEARTTYNSAYAKSVETVQSTLGQNIASVQTTLSTGIGTLDTMGRKVDGIGALYTAKVAVNGLVGGFGVYNDGREIEAGFEVDRFYIGRTANLYNSGKSEASKQLPFMVSDGVVYINEARVNTLSIAGASVTVPAFIASGGNNAGIPYRIPLASGESPWRTYQVFLLGNAQNGLTDDYSITVDGSPVWTSRVIGGITVTGSTVVNLIPGVDYYISFQGNTNTDTSLYILATKR